MQRNPPGTFTNPLFPRGIRAMLVTVLLLLGCRTWTPAPPAEPGAPVSGIETTVQPVSPTATPALAALPSATPLPSGSRPERWHSEPAGCLDAAAQAALAGTAEMLAYADTLVRLDRALADRAMPAAWNAAQEAYSYQADGPISIDVAGVKNVYLIQRMLNALHVAGFVTWLRDSDRPEQALHILAIPLRDPALLEGDWKDYVTAYWQDAQALPPRDPSVRSTLKLPPCHWMVAQGLAPAVDPGWWPEGSDRWPDYAASAQTYLAVDTAEATRVAQQINWIEHLEAANTMCGPLTWSILRDAGAFPPGMGAWMEGPKTFWLAKPTENGRPWNLFPSGSYTVHHVGTALSRFDFSTFPLYSGDVLYLYSEKDGFDHILIVTETHPDGSVFTVTNLTREHPERSVSIERRLLLHAFDRSAGLARNEWEDRSNGRTGHAGFDIFRWDWMEKDITNTAVPYVVLPGDTLDFVAVRWKTPAAKIARYNGIAIADRLVVGQELSIPPNQWEQ